jgi:hypothetical protein
MSNVLANAAIPIFFPHPIMALLALIPIVWVESMVLKQRFELQRAHVLVANIISTVLGAGFALVCVIFLGAFNMFLTRDGTTLSALLMMLAFVVLPCFVLSIIVEGAYLRSYADPDESRPFWRTIIKAHIYSYLVLIGLDCAWITFKVW